MARKTVLVAPLHWGLGHAARCIPLIKQQLDQGHEVLIAATDGPKALLSEHFATCRFVDIPFMKITYPRDGNMARHFFLRGPQLLWSIWCEHKLLKKLVKKESLDLVISDSRFGLWNKQVQSIFITHQVEIKSPVFQRFINSINRWVMNRFDEVWIPDYEQTPGLAGELSHPIKMPLKYTYIGPLSRFEKPIIKSNSANKIVALISGPEPQRTMFENDIVERFKDTSQEVLILSGKPGPSRKREMNNINVINHLNDEALISALESAALVIARSGYSTIMDFHVLGVQAELIATPGQTEQEYLNRLHKP